MPGKEPLNQRIDSRIEGFRKLDPKDRLKVVAKITGLTKEQTLSMTGDDVLSLERANGMIENVIGKFELPIGVATNFVVNDRDYLIPMVVEEPSVVAAASYMARIARTCGGFITSSTKPIMRAQVQIVGLSDPYGARTRLLAHADTLIDLANSKDAILIGLGGGCKDIEVHIFDDTPIGPMVVLHLLVDVRDAMGANTVNTMAEMVAPEVEKITGGKTRLRILSNLADRRLVRANVTLTPEAMTTNSLNGEDVIQGIVEACALAIVDPYRAATHNKGIMNGIDPVVVATGNDWRAIEAGAHAWAARKGQYTSLSRWEITSQGHLTGSLELPMAVGIVGGATKTHPAAQTALDLMKVSSAQELAEVIAAVGLAQNMAALRALATEGIQKGHMALHARNIAIMAGAKAEHVDNVAQTITKAGEINLDKAREVLAALEKNP